MTSGVVLDMVLSLTDLSVCIPSQTNYRTYNKISKLSEYNPYALLDVLSHTDPKQ